MNDRRIPPRYQEELLGSVNALAESIDCTPPSAEDDEEEEEEDEKEDDGEGRGKGKGNGKGKKGRD